MSTRDKDLIYYHNEMSFLRHMGRAFCKKYPKIAHRLNFSTGETSDPHLERLLESFAFLTSYLQQDIDGQLPRLSGALLSILYPHLTAPIPPMSIAQFKPSSAKPMTASYTVPRHFPLYTGTLSNEMCYFRTGYDTEIWPIQIENIELIHSETVDFTLSPHAYMLKISLKALKTPFSKLDIKSLRFFINGTSMEQIILYQLLLQEKVPVALQSKKGGAPKILPDDSIHPVGFNLDENLVPCPSNAHPAYGLLQEYFAFPQKFMFFDLKNLDFSQAEEEAFLYIPIIDEVAAQTITFPSYRLLLGCTPIVNLFHRTSEPIHFDHKKIEYRMVPDYRREMTTQIHSIDKVFLSSLNNSEVHQIEPYFSYTHEASNQKQTVFWSARRRDTINTDIPGTDLWLSFVNWDLTPEVPAANVAYASILCTNRALASLITSDTLLKTNDPIPAESIVCLYPPTKTLYPSHEGQTQWQLISSLSTNYLSLSSGKESVAVLKEILRLFNMSDESRDIAPDCIVNLETKPIVRRMGSEAWRGFAKGTEIILSVDEEYQNGGINIFLFSQVLNHFFGLYAQINSFTQLTLKSIHKEGVWKTWPARAGAYRLI